MTRRRNLIISFKTTHNAHPDAFARTIIDQGWDMQAAFELDAVEALAGHQAHYVWLCAEVEPPYACSLVGLTPELLAYGQSRMHRAVATWAECLRGGVWPAYPDRICYAGVPPWALAAERGDTR